MERWDVEMLLLAPKTVLKRLEIFLQFVRGKWSPEVPRRDVGPVMPNQVARWSAIPECLPHFHRISDVKLQTASRTGPVGVDGLVVQRIGPDVHILQIDRVVPPAGVGEPCL